ncbi:MAG: SpoIIE family protein phosphatase [Planctomycetota bacterium]
MTKKLPPPLRLHVAEEPTAPPSPSVVRDALGAVANAFEVATGWRVDRDTQRLNGASIRQHRLTVTAAGKQDAESQATASIERWRADQLADAISDLFARLDTLQTAVWHREAELAIGVPVSPKRQEEEHLAARLEVMLRNGADAAGCCAAGLYLLDGATSELKLRACWGLPKDRFLEPARPLADAFAELEALIGHAVVLEDVSRVPHWKTPEPFPAALCVPVASPTDPLGTIWFFADSVRDFSDQEIHLAEIVAGGIAAELQREVLLAECLASKQADRQIVRAVRWQHDHLPTIKPLLEDWDVAGWSATDDELAGGFYDWFVPPDGSLAVTLGTCAGSRVESALSAGALQASVRAHADYAHNTAKMISRVNDTMWNSSTGGHLGSLFYCKATPDSGEIEYSTAGTVQAILVQRSDIELIRADSRPLGVEPDLSPETARLHLAAGDLLLILSTSSERPSQQLELSRQLRAHRGATADELLELVRSIDAGANLALILQRRDLSE